MRPGGAVALEKRIDRPLSGETVDGHLPRGCSLCRPEAKRLTNEFPFAVGVALRIGEHDVIVRSHRCVAGENQPGAQSKGIRHFHDRPPAILWSGIEEV